MQKRIWKRLDWRRFELWTCEIDHILEENRFRLYNWMVALKGSKTGNYIKMSFLHDFFTRKVGFKDS